MIYTILENTYIQFSFQLLISELVFLLNKPKRNHFSFRIVTGMVIYLLLAVIWEILVIRIAGDSILPYALLYLGYALMSSVLIWGCFDIKLMELVFILAGGYATEHMCFAFSRISLYVLGYQYILYGGLAHLLITRYLFYIVGAVTIYFLLIKGNKDQDSLEMVDVRIIFLTLILLMTAIIMSICWSQPSEYIGTLMGEVICPAYSFLCSAFVLIMEYYILRENSMKREREIMEQLIQLSDSQQKSAKEVIDIINIKCHDLKHQIRALAKMEDSKTRSDYLQEVQEAVSIYDATYHTGCKALDYVLREKTLLFNEYQVQFSCMVDGEAIVFMTSADIYALMGNALDNALERVLQEEDDERIISLHIKSRGQMILIHLENRCSREPLFQDGLPVTDKEDKRNHGFGVRSIRYITEKYDGELLMHVKNGRFFLDILLPQPDYK